MNRYFPQATESERESAALIAGVPGGSEVEVRVSNRKILVGVFGILAVAIAVVIAIFLTPRMSPATSIEGVVSTVDGEPLQLDKHGKAGSVEVYRLTSRGEYEAEGFAEIAKDGRFSISDVPEGSYKVWFDPHGTGYAMTWWENKLDEETATVVRIDNDNKRAVLHPVLQRGAVISGTVRGAVDRGLEANQDGAFGEVTAYRLGIDGKPGFEASAEISKTGEYSLGGLPAGTYAVRFSAPGTVHAPIWWKNEPDEVKAATIVLRAGQEKADADAQFEIGGSISGMVKGADGKPLKANKKGSHGWVEVSRLTPQGNYLHENSAKIAADGTYQLVGLPGGSYRVAFYPEDGIHVHEWWDNQPTWEAATSLDLTLGQKRDRIDAVLSR